MQNTTTAEILEERIQEAKNGDAHAFTQIVHDHQAYAYALAYRFLCHESDAEDVVQESFIKIWKHLPDFDPKTKFTTWMYRIVVNVCYDKLKSNKRRNRIIEQFDSESFESKCAGESHIDKIFMEKEIAEFIQYFAGELSEKQRMIFLLRDMQELSIEEVGSITGMSVSSIKSNLFSARQNIRKKLVKLELNI
jgi:RNA polymerase sigma-70 factor, ECF subfamily